MVKRELKKFVKHMQGAMESADKLDDSGELSDVLANIMGEVVEEFK